METDTDAVSVHALLWVATALWLAAQLWVTKALSDAATLTVGILVAELLADEELLDDQLACPLELWDTNPLSDTIAVVEGRGVTEFLAEPELLTDPLALTVELWDTSPVLDALPELLWDAALLSEIPALLVGILVEVLLAEPELLAE